MPFGGACARMQNGGMSDRLRLAAMIFDYVMGGGVAALISVYLVYALLRPERF